MGRGDLGIVHGQYLDLYGKIGSLDDLINVYERKTASLIRACCVIGYTFMQKLDAKEYLAVLYGALRMPEATLPSSFISSRFKSCGVLISPTSIDLPYLLYAYFRLCSRSARINSGITSA